MAVEASNTQTLNQFNNYRERCDRCSAQAQKRVTQGELDLFFCNHHFNKHDTVLFEQGWVLEIPEPVIIEDKTDSDGDDGPEKDGTLVPA